MFTVRCRTIPRRKIVVVVVVNKLHSGVVS